MQSLAAYSFGAQVEAPAARLARIDQLIDRWLADKGADDVQASDGSFVSRSGDGTGQFSRAVTHSEIGVSRHIELLETTHTGAMFTTTLQIAEVAGKVSVHASLSATPGASVVAPIKLYPRCPRILRALIAEFDDWTFAGQEVPVGRAFDATTDAAADLLCAALRSPARKLPLVIVSMDADEAVWADLHDRVADHLIGLADVAFVNAETSWRLTELLGPSNSCYLGAVRLYWPVARADGSFEGAFWTAQRLAQFGADEAGQQRFLSLLRRTVMGTAALTMVQPGCFRAIQNAATKARLARLEAGARDSELDTIIEENARLSAALNEALSTIAQLQWRLAATAPADEAASEAVADSAVPEGPQKGEIRHYKKIGSGGGFDALVATKSCAHKTSNWRAAFKGGQAAKGLLKLEGRDDWQSIWHCSACTGGGRWRVHW